MRHITWKRIRLWTATIPFFASLVGLFLMLVLVEACIAFRDWRKFNMRAVVDEGLEICVDDYLYKRLSAGDTDNG